ncbi:hypothetical protein [Methylobacterium organophilum]|uniref:Uncharacterized protein n=1 Tax=Methylobacterium organophilum TaxID=410 RepID=A0ABQ4TB60_METOR|nr:hypothetical protein [Methylobacterium organophilum]GJE28872.1 hypothetical protein LKMONMHP_3746 [Methylobacterium organophilum]
MTAEITIINRNGVALAADSAVTIGRQRVWKTANKLFSLSPFNDIAIMAYGAGDFAGVPWEIVIKTFRANIGSKRYDTVEECANDLVQYLKSLEITQESEERASILLLFIKIFERMKKRIGECATAAEFKQKIAKQISAEQAVADRQAPIDLQINLKDFTDKYGDTIFELEKDVFKTHITKKIHNELMKLCHNCFGRASSSTYETGLVVAGFGKNQIFPCQIAYIIDGKHKDILRYWSIEEKNADLNKAGTSNSIITPFGQGDIAILFLEGIARQHLDYIRKSLKILLDEKSDSLVKAYVQDEDEKKVESALQKRENDKTISKLGKEFLDYRDKGLVQPIMRVIATLPKEEMAAMAEALVEITSLRRRVDSPLESVGGPTDVAVISKGDGLVWMKRKHYFDPILNGDFARRKQLQFEERRDETRQK